MKKGSKEGSYVVKVTNEDFPLWKEKRPLLTHLDIELTERCNNNCIHCYINLPEDDVKAKEQELTTEEIKEILKEAAQLGCLRVRFTGGEPLLREDFEEIYVFARKQGLKVLIFTNATLIKPELAELFARIPPLGKIEITVYGLTKSSYEAVTRVPGSFEAAMQGTNHLLKKKIPFVVRSALLPPNKNEMNEFEAWASTIPWMDHPPSYSMFFDLRCRRDSEAKNEQIKRLRPSLEESLKVLTRRGDEYFKCTIEFCSKFMRPPDERLFSCNAGVRGGCVDAYGCFQLCMLARHPATVYNLKYGSLEKAIVSFSPKVRQMKANNSDYLARCANCFLRALCEQCPAKSWMEHGSLDTPVDYHCEIAHAQARLLGLLKLGERAWEVGSWDKRIKEISKNEWKLKLQQC